MLAPADVLSIQCKFVEKMKTFLNKRKSLINLCVCEVIPYFADAQLATLLEDCLTHTDECNLEKKASKYGAQPEVNPDTVLCASQVDVTLSSSSATCSTTVFPSNISGQVYPKIFLENDEIYHDAKINIVAYDCTANSTQYETVKVGCSGDPESCTDSQRVAILMAFTLSNPIASYPGGYINLIRLYATDTNGVLVNSPLDLDVSPSNVSAWTACGTCNPVNGSELYFSHANYDTAWATLMDNISRTLYSDDVNLQTSISSPNSGSWYYYFYAKHNPAGVWIGPNRNDFLVQVYDGVSSIVTPTSTVLPFTQGSFLHQEVEFDVACGTVTATADSFAGGGAIAGPLANFNFLQFTTQDIVSLPITVTATGDTTCTLVTLTATYTTTQTVDSVEWRDPSNNIISTTTTVKVNGTETGTYDFRVYLANGCVVSETITI